MSVASIGGGYSTSFTALPSITQDLQRAALDQAEKTSQQRKTSAQEQAVLDEARKAQQKTEDQARLQAQQQSRAQQTAFGTQAPGAVDVYL
jgi:hypothetical protein